MRLPRTQINIKTDSSAYSMISCVEPLNPRGLEGSVTGPELVNR
jgi:hypothetical protein